MTRGLRKAIAHPKFWAVEKLFENFTFGEFFSKNAKFEAKTPILGKLKLKF